jgi:hypothetical protein
MKTVASLATIPGREHTLAGVIEALRPQVDTLCVSLNGHTRSAYCEFSKRWPDVMFARALNNAGDAAKFRAPLLGYDVHLTCDDDIVYPADYVERMVEELARARRDYCAAAVCVHGARLKEPFSDFYRDRVSYHYGQALESAQRVQIPGTGTFAYCPDDVRFTRYDFPHMNMADVQAAVRLMRAGIHVYAIARERGWLQAADPTNQDTIWHASTQRRDGSVMNTGEQQTAFVMEHRALFFR